MKVLLIIAVCAGMVLNATETSGGIVHVPKAKSVAVDGSAADWDISLFNLASIDIDDPSAPQYEYAFCYSDDALYLLVKVYDTTPMMNKYLPHEWFWQGDLVQLRISVASNTLRTYDDYRDNAPNDAVLPSVNHISIWNNDAEDKSYVHIIKGTFNKASTLVDPEGVECVVSRREGKGYIIEAKVPWVILGTAIEHVRAVRMPAFLEVIWGDNLGKNPVCREPAIYAVNPGVWGFRHWDEWGRLTLLAPGEMPPVTGAVSRIRGIAARETIPVNVSAKSAGVIGMVIYDERGEAVRELVSERSLGGSVTMHWDGKDRFGEYVKPGNFRYEAMSAPAVRARYIGAVGSSGEPPHNTADGLGEWGSDHDDPVDATSDDSGIYFLWPSSEQGRSVVKIGYDGKTIWRVSPVAAAGWGNFTSIASDGKYVYLQSAQSFKYAPEIMRLNAQTGRTFISGSSHLKLSEKKVTSKDEEGSVGMGLAVANGIGYASLYYEDTIQIFDCASMALTGALALERPYGLAVDAAGDLYAISRGDGTARAKVVRFTKAQGRPIDVITKDLEAPVDIGILPDGSYIITDAGTHQVKYFAKDGTLKRTLGRSGGRPWMGAYEPENFLRPWGLHVLADSSFIVVENSPPKVFSRFSADGRLMKRWFGPATYGTSVWGDPCDAGSVFYVVSEQSGDGQAVSGAAASAVATHLSFARARIDLAAGTWAPEAYWCFPQTDMPPPFYTFAVSVNIPDIFIYRGASYMHSSAITFGYRGRNGVTAGSLMKFDGNTFTPVMSISLLKTNNRQYPRFASWTKDGGRYTERDAVTNIPLPSTIFGFYVHTNMDVIYEADGKRIVRIPFIGIDADGVHRWDTARAQTVIADYAVGIDKKDLGDKWRWGVRGIRSDSAGNLYVSWCAGPDSKGLYWSSHLTQARLSKFDASGNHLWSRGLKAMAARKDGEIYNIWTIAGLIDDTYVALADEAGMIHFYSSDGFYRGHIFNDLSKGEAGAFTFTGETFSGRVIRDQRTGKCYAYQGQTAGLVFEVSGLGDEARSSGSITVDSAVMAKIQARDAAGMKQEIGSLAEVRDAAAAAGIDWTKISPTTIIAGPKEIAAVRACFGEKQLYLKFDVKKEGGFVNGADTAAMLFNGGDAVSFYIGSAGDRTKPGVGDARIVIGMLGDKNVVYGMKARSELKSPQRYTSPVSSVEYEWAGEVPNAAASRQKQEKGYALYASVPLSFFDIPFRSGTKIRFDAEVIMADASGAKVRERYFAFSQGSRASMVNDIPTQAWLYPDLWRETVLGNFIEMQRDHSDVGSAFDAKRAVFLEAERARVKPERFMDHRGKEGALSITKTGIPKDAKFVWDVPNTLSPGMYRVFVSWTRGGHASATHVVSAGGSDQALRMLAKVSDTNISWQMRWSPAERPVEVRAEDRVIVVEPTITYNSPQAPYYLDAVAFVPEP